MNCRINDLYVIHPTCVFRAIGHNIFKVNATFPLLRNISKVWVHFETMYRYTSYRAYPINRWENVCAFLAGKDDQIITKIVFSNLQRYTNVNHTCPFLANEILKFQVDRINMDYFKLDYLLPAGDYRMNLTYTEGVERNHVIALEVSFAISDYRIWH